MRAACAQQRAPASLQRPRAAATSRPPARCPACVLARSQASHGALCSGGASLAPRAAAARTADARRVAARGSKDSLDCELEATQKTLDKVLQAVEAAQAAAQQQPQQQQPTGHAADATLAAREQQLWERQQALLERMQQQLDCERQAWLERERLLLTELAQLRAELTSLLLARASASGAATAASAAPHAAQPAASQAASSQPEASASPAPATISGASSASAAVASALRAVRDSEAVSPALAPAGSSSSSDGSSSGGGGGDGAPGASWQSLFAAAPAGSAEPAGDSSGAAASIAAAMAAVDSSDVLSGLDLSFGRGRRRADPSSPAQGSNGSSNGSSSGSAPGGGEPAPAPAPAAAAAAAAAAAGPPVEVQRGDPGGPPPLLSVGDDDIYWVSKLHGGLMAGGFYPSDDEVENWLFGDGTQTALLTYQACNSLPETGVTCESTWRQLLGDAEYQAACRRTSSDAITDDGGADASSSSDDSGDSSATSSGGGDSGGVVAEAVEAVEASNGEVTYTFAATASSSTGSSSSGGSSSTTSSSSGSSSGRKSSSGWPVVMDLDGGREVHALQVALARTGFHCGDDEMRWWQFGSSTLDALKTFQACSGLPESGVCDERTWLALLGPDAAPEDLDQIRGDESMYEDDMAAPHDGAVWLLGEQRWSRPV